MEFTAGAPTPTEGAHSEGAQREDALFRALGILREFVTSELGGLHSSDGSTAATVVGVVERFARQVDAIRLQAMASIERAGVPAADGHSPTAWMALAARCSYSEGKRRFLSARALRDLPLAAAAYDAGELGTEQLGLLARVRANPRCGDQLPDFESILVAQAKALSFNDFRHLVGRWEELADADGAEQRAERNHRNRNGRLLQQGDDSWTLEASFGASQGAVMKEIYDRFVDAERVADWAEARAEHGEDTTVEHLRRTEPQRRADALARIFEQAATAGSASGTIGFIVNIVVDQHTLESHLAAMADDAAPTPAPTPAPTRAPTPSRFSDYRCETMSGHRIDPASAAVAAIIGHVRSVLFNAGQASISTKSRLFRGGLKDLLNIRDRHCVHPGCSIASTRCESDHATPFARGGTTSEANGAPRCDSHNLWKERPGVRVWRDPGGTWHTIRPDGTEIQAAA
jgi:hypothetical protein